MFRILNEETITKIRHPVTIPLLYPNKKIEG